MNLDDNNPSIQGKARESSLLYSQAPNIQIITQFMAI